MNVGPGMPTFTRTLLLVSTVLLAVDTKLSGDTRFESGAKRVALLELYTSQGCSSCPPAESWLNGFENDPRLWKTVVPVAFHVDYWDRLGWEDPFASEAYTKRQYRYRQTGGIDSVYTPGFVLNGKEWRGWFNRSDLRISNENTGNLSVSIEDGNILATYSDFNDEHRLNIALMAIGLQTHVKSGENRNRNLKQSFVSLSHGLYFPAKGSWRVPLPSIDTTGSQKVAIAVWITSASGFEPIQATGGWLPEYLFD